MIIIKNILIFVLAVLFLINNSEVAFSREVPGLSGTYKGYNIILIILDALRADHLSALGYSKRTSPNIDKLAQEGVLFTNTFSQASITLPSIASIFTSLYPYSHRLVYILKDRMPDKISTISQVLNLYGYDTIWFGMLADPHSGSAPGMLKGFNEKYDLTPLENKKGNEEILRWLKNSRDKPFFMAIHSYSVHEQFFPFLRFNNEFSRGIPKDFLGLIDSFDKRYPDFFGSTKSQEQKIALERTRIKAAVDFFESLDKKNITYFLSLLDSAIFEIDKDMVGRLIEGLKENNLYDKTIIIITADHGNLYGEHGKFGHGFYLYDEVMRVPFILHLPKFKGRRVVKDLVQSIDMFPTIMDLLSIPVPRQAQGISLVGLMEGRKKALHNEYVFCEPRGNPLGPFAIRSRNWKLLQYPGVDGRLLNNDMPDRLNFKLFDLKNDPAEIHNLIEEKPTVAATLKGALDSWKDGLFVYQQGLSDFIPGLQEETKERIRKTGYW